MSPQLAGLLIILMEYGSSFIGFLLSYFAMKGYRASSARGLLLLYLGFVVLGMGIFLRATTATYSAIVLRITETPGYPLLGSLYVAGWIYTLTQLAAYSLFVAAFLFQRKESGRLVMDASLVSAAAFPIYRLFFNPALELVAMTLLGFVAVHSLIHWSLKRSIESAFVALGFGFMFLSHVFYLFMRFDELFLIVGQVAQLVGFVCLLLMLVKVSKVNAQGA